MSGIHKKIFITGIAGFIGYHTAIAAKKKGWDVDGIDDFNDYYDPKLKYARAKLLQENGITYHKVSLLAPAKMEKIITRQQTTHVIHLAAQAGCRYAMLHPEKYTESNLIGFTNMIEICRKYPQMVFVYASSSSVYGLNEKTPFSESDTCDQPANYYGATKKSNELTAFAYHHIYGIPVIGLRFFTVYGPWGRPDMATFFFTKHILEGIPIQLFNHGKMKRDFTYIDDIVDGIIASLDCTAATQKGCEIYNLGNNQPVILTDMISIIENLLGKKAIIENHPMQPGEVLETYADITKAHKELGFTPKTSLAEGMKHFLSWYRSYQ